MDTIQALCAVHPVLSTIAIVLICWCAAAAVVTGIWIVCFPAIRYVPQAPGCASQRRRIS